MIKIFILLSLFCVIMSKVTRDKLLMVTDGLMVLYQSSHHSMSLWKYPVYKHSVLCLWEINL